MSESYHENFRIVPKPPSRKAVASVISMANRKRWDGSEQLRAGKERLPYTRFDQAQLRDWVDRIIAAEGSKRRRAKAIEALFNEEIRPRIPRPSSIDANFDVQVLSSEPFRDEFVSSAEFVTLAHGPWPDPMRAHREFGEGLRWCAFQLWVLRYYDHLSRIRKCIECEAYFMDWPRKGKGKPPLKYCPNKSCGDNHRSRRYYHKRKSR